MMEGCHRISQTIGTNRFGWVIGYFNAFYRFRFDQEWFYIQVTF